MAGQTDIDVKDIRAFRAASGLSANDPQIVLDGKDPGTVKTDESEADLDIEWAGAVARNATVIYVTHDQLEAVTMADKMAVMNGGFLQQYDAPQRVFANPVNTFVAGFVGSPAMSLIPLELGEDGGETGLHSADGWILPLSPANAQRARGASSRKVVVGARHSTLTIHRSPTAGANLKPWPLHAEPMT